MPCEAKAQGTTRLTTQPPEAGVEAEEAGEAAEVAKEGVTVSA